jgi:hypothetical protein
MDTAMGTAWAARRYGEWFRCSHQDRNGDGEGDVGVHSHECSGGDPVLSDHRCAPDNRVQRWMCQCLATPACLRVEHSFERHISSRQVERSGRRQWHAGGVRWPSALYLLRRYGTRANHRRRVWRHLACGHPELDVATSFDPCTCMQGRRTLGVLVPCIHISGHADDWHRSHHHVSYISSSCWSHGVTICVRRAYPAGRTLSS